MVGHLNACIYLVTRRPSDCRCADEEKHYWKLAALSLAGALIQIILGIVSQSLAVMSDGAHGGSDMLENLISAGIANRARWSENEEALRLWGGRASALLIFIVSIFIVKEAVARLASPEVIAADIAIIGAIAGLAINCWQAYRHMGAHDEHRNITHHLQWLHILFDLMGSVAAIIGVVVVMFWGYVFADTIASLFIVGIIWFRVIKWLIHGVESGDSDHPHENHGHNHH